MNGKSVTTELQLTVVQHYVHCLLHNKKSHMASKLLVQLSLKVLLWGLCQFTVFPEARPLLTGNTVGSEV